MKTLKQEPMIKYKEILEKIKPYATKTNLSLLHDYCKRATLNFFHETIEIAEKQFGLRYSKIFAEEFDRFFEVWSEESRKILSEVEASKIKEEKMIKENKNNQQKEFEDLLEREKSSWSQQYKLLEKVDYELRREIEESQDAVRRIKNDKQNLEIKISEMHERLASRKCTCVIS